MPFQSTVIGIINADGTRPDPPQDDGTFQPIILQFGPGLSAGTPVQNGSTVTVPMRLTGAPLSPLHVPLYVGGGAANPSGPPGWSLTGTSGSPAVPAMDIIGAQDLVAGATKVIFRAVFAVDGGSGSPTAYVDLSTDGSTEVTGSQLSNASPNFQQHTADVSSTYAATSVNTIVQAAFVRCWATGGANVILVKAELLIS